MIPLRRTKIVATIGPASDAIATIKEMIMAGMNVARINLSFGVNGQQQERIRRIRAAADELGANVAVMVDTRGIEIRTGPVEGEALALTANADFALYSEARCGDATGVSVSYAGLYHEVAPGNPILLDDGAIELVVLQVDGTTIHTRIIHGGMLRANKGVNLPDTQLSLSAVSPETREEVMREMSFAADNDVEYVAASFIQSADDITRMKELLKERGADIPIIAKIENKAGVRNLPEIVAAADGVMVARGDLGVELPLADVPGMQKKIIATTVSSGKPVITATQMLASMELNPKPTRAEASDVANAILDGTSAVMLSGETAMGKYPVQAVRMMATLATRAEASLAEYGYLQKIQPNPSNKVTEAVSQASIAMANHLGAAAIICLTDTGFTARQISKHRPECPILAVTMSNKVFRKLSMNWGVFPILHMGEYFDEAKVRYGIEKARELGYIKTDDIVVITAGHHQVAGGTDYIRVITVDAP